MLDALRSAAVKPAALIRKEPFFFVALFLTLIFALLSPPHISAVRWNVIVLLFSLMLVGQAFDRCMLLASVARFSIGICKTPKRLGLVMILTTGLLAMFVTNDVALLTIVPLTMTMARLSGKDPYRLIVLETMAANIFSALTPFGNPQNLYLYSYYRLQPGEFFSVMAPFGLLGFLLLLGINQVVSRGEAYEVKPERFRIKDGRLLAAASLLFFLNILSVFGVVDYRFVFVLTVFVFLILAPILFRRVDYCLLSTFLLFFLFADSVAGMSSVRSLLTETLRTKETVLLFSAGLSQIISNVPASVLLSGFTEHYRQLIYGVSAGGLGTPIASLASLISFKLYVRENRPEPYRKLFYILNFSMLIVLLAGAFLIGFQNG